MGSVSFFFCLSAVFLFVESTTTVVAKHTTTNKQQKQQHHTHIIRKPFLQMEWGEATGGKAWRRMIGRKK